MTEKHKDKMVNTLISTIVSVACVLIAASLSGKAADEKEIKDAIKGKASVEYVDKLNKEYDEEIKSLKSSDLLLKTYVDEQNRNQNVTLEQRLAERDKVNLIILDELKYIRQRVNQIPTK